MSLMSDRPGLRPLLCFPRIMLAATVVLSGAVRADIIDGVTVHGFADAYYTYTTQQDSPSGNTGFRLGNLDLYLSPNFTGRVRALMEDVVEFDDWTAPGTTNGQPSIDIERLQIGYLLSNDAIVWFGRFHTPYGYWNTAYHHGAQLQPTVERPQFVAFEDHGGVLPAHMNGLWLSGHYQDGPGRFTYDVYLGNGQRILTDQLDMENLGAANSHTALGTRLGYEFRGGALDSLWLGIHAVDEEVNAYNASNALIAQTDVRIVGGFVHWTPGDFEIFGEYYGFENRAHDGGPTHASNAWYAEADYTFLGLWTPLARVERDALNQHDGYFQYLLGGQSYTRELVGLRYDLTPQTALKLDADHTNATRDGGQSYNEVHFQVAVRF